MDLRRRTCVIGVLLLYITVCSSHPFDITTLKEEIDESYYMLSNAVEPLDYEIDLTLPENFETTKAYEGIVKIKIKLKAQTDNPTDIISLHMSDITLTDTKSRVYEFKDEISLTENRLVQNEKPKINSTLEMVTFKIDKSNLLGKAKQYILELHFIGKLHEDMYGFYLSSYKEKGVINKQYLATTQFQPTYARRAFPCFDEPNTKARFKISITHPSEYQALSNTDGTRTGTGILIKTQFKETPKMSTYLVAFLVSKFEKFSTQYDGLTNSVWAQKDFLPAASYSSEMTPKILKAMTEFTGVTYEESTPTKLDQVAIPDFAAKTMENWGLATYRENYFLWNEAESTVKNKQGVATAVAHELAHTWFGNLITCTWWSSIWLNEGLATYFEYYAVDKVDTKDWRLKEQFVVEQHQTILNMDAWDFTKALTTDVFTPNQISEKFNYISYKKGGSVIRMVENIMGEKAFFAGIKEYFKTENKLRFGNSEPQDLWEALQKKVGKGVLPKDITLSNVMKNWSEKPGFPVVTVSMQNGTLKLHAKRFFNDPEKEEVSDWYIPLSYTTSKDANFNSTSPKEWIQLNETVSIKFQPNEDNPWIIFNIKETAYIRVNYENQLWVGIQNALQKENHDGIPALNRAQVVDDVMNLARSGQTTYRTALDIIQYLQEEVDYIPWYSAFNTFAYLRQRFDIDDEILKYLDAHISILMGNLYKSISFYNTPKEHVDKLKKELTLNWACELEDEKCVSKSKQQFDKMKLNQSLIDVELRSFVYCTALRHAESSENWEFLRERLRRTRIAPEIARIISALGCTKNETLLNQYLKDSINPKSDIRRQDAQSVFISVISGNQEGIPIGLKFLIENFRDIDENYGGLNDVSKVLVALADKLIKQDQCDELEMFVERIDLKEATDAGENAIEICKLNMKWASTYREDILAYLKEKIDGPTTTETSITAGGVAITTNLIVSLISIIAIISRT